MLGPIPYKPPAPVSVDTPAPKPALAGVEAPSDLKVTNGELLSLAEAPDVQVPSTYDDALRNDELLNHPELIDPTTTEIFPSVASKEEIAFGVPVPVTTDVNAFGGGVGVSAAPGTTVVSATSPLTTEEKAVVLQNTVLVESVGITGASSGMIEYELGTKLPNSVAGSNTLQSILAIEATFGPVDTEIIQVQQFVVPPAPDIVDGGEF